MTGIAIMLALTAINICRQLGAQGYEVGNAIANEWIFAEFVDVALVLIAVTARHRLCTSE